MLVGSEIGAALVVARGDAPRRARHQLRHRPGRDAGAPALPQPALAAADQRAAQRRPAEHRRRPHPLRPHARAAGRVPRAATSPSSASRVVGGCCGTTPEHLRQVVEAVKRPRRRRRRTPDVRAERVVDLQPGADRAGPQLPASSASAPTPTAPRRSATRCSPATGTPARRWPTSRSARAPTSSTSASTTSAATAPSTWTRSPSASPPRPACRWCSTPPRRRCWRPACSTSAAGPSSTRPTSRTASCPAAASTG